MEELSKISEEIVASDEVAIHMSLSDLRVANNDSARELMKQDQL